MDFKLPILMLNLFKHHLHLHSSSSSSFIIIIFIHHLHHLHLHSSSSSSFIIFIIIIIFIFIHHLHLHSSSSTDLQQTFPDIFQKVHGNAYLFTKWGNFYGYPTNNPIQRYLVILAFMGTHKSQNDQITLYRIIRRVPIKIPPFCK